jgi:hypothetical protein
MILRERNEFLEILRGIANSPKEIEDQEGGINRKFPRSIRLVVFN